MLRIRPWAPIAVAATALMLAYQPASASASVAIGSSAQCRDTTCLVQLAFRTSVARTATVTAGGASWKIAVRPGSTERLARVRGVTANFPVRVAFEGRTTSRTVARRVFAINTPTRTCATLASTGAQLSVGPMSAQTKAFSVPSRGTLRIAVIFVDFSDAPAVDTIDSVMASWVTPGVNRITTSSYGRVSPVLAPRSATWLRMPKPSTGYGMDDGTTYEEHRAYIEDALSVADASMDFTGVKAVYVIPARGASTNASQAFHGTYGTFTLDGQPLGPAVTYGQWAYESGRGTVPHETGHMFGLPDLYAYASTGQFRYTGVWDYMGNIFDFTDLTAWQRTNISWLDHAQILCARPTGTSWAMLSPLGSTGGHKALFVRTGTYTGLVVENRQRVGNDKAICKPGALVYVVDSRVPTGAGPVRVLGGDRSGRGCGFGLQSDAPLRVGQSLSVGRTTVRVLGSQSGRLEVSLTRQ